MLRPASAKRTKRFISRANSSPPDFDIVQKAQGQRRTKTARGSDRPVDLFVNLGVLTQSQQTVPDKTPTGCQPPRVSCIKESCPRCWAAAAVCSAAFMNAAKHDAILAGVGK